MSACAVMFLLALADPDIIVLENGHVRIEVDPRLFAPRYIGIPGGVNFIEAAHVDPADKEGDGWADPGGLHTDLIPYVENDAALRRGPAEVLEVSPTSLALLGPPSDKSRVRLKKEFQIYPGQAKVRYRVTAYAAAALPVQYALRNTARVRPKATIRTSKSVGELRGFPDPKPPDYAIVKSMRYWLVPVPPTSDTDNLVLGGWIQEVELQNPSGVWTRKLMAAPESPGEVPNGATLLCLLDDSTRSYGVAFQGAVQKIAADQPAVLEEIWTFDKRGR